MPIPTENKGLADLNKGRHVLAQYPVSFAWSCFFCVIFGFDLLTCDCSKDTTTFYKAEVSANWRSKDLAIDRGDYVRLSFEGDEMKVMEVERRFVLAEKEK
jgi:SAGA-associated factor 29